MSAAHRDPAVHRGDAIQRWVSLRARACRWPVHAPRPGISPERIREATSVPAMLALSDDPAAQLAAARARVGQGLQLDVPRLAPRHAYGHDRIRIGYLSGELGLHPVAMLAAELFELHDRARFEVHAFDWSREDGSGLRRRVVKAFDRFERIHALDDAAAARLIREREIDVLVDLQGQTPGARPQVLMHRPAPIQVTYLGQAATSGLPCIDYVIADRYLIPRDSARFYTETPLYLPDVYQCSDRQRSAAPAPSRASCGLPEGAFVFCCFNASHAYTAEMFAAWMKILARVPGSVLWLLADSPQARTNLRAAAAGLGIDPQRLVFASRTTPDRERARSLVAELFLDSFPFNAATAANDALWMGLPVLTRSGRSYASRTAGALLTATGMTELITTDLRAYVEKAVALGREPDQAQRLRADLGRVRQGGVLFDTPRLVKQLEARFAELVRALPEPAAQAARPDSARPAR